MAAVLERIDDMADEAYERAVAEQLNERSCRNCRHQAVSADTVSVRCTVRPGSTVFIRPLKVGEVLKDTRAERDQLTTIAAKCRNFQGV